jgi:hypothetical protein
MREMQSRAINGCATSGKLNNNDWIVDCDSSPQEENFSLTERQAQGVLLEEKATEHWRGSHAPPFAGRALGALFVRA